MPAPPQSPGTPGGSTARHCCTTTLQVLPHAAFRELNPRTPFAANWHFELIAAKLAAVREGHIRRLIVSLPPRHLKSHLASIAFPAWCLGHDPSAQIICVSYAQDLADKLSRDCRRILASDWYQRLFPTRLSPQASGRTRVRDDRAGLARRHLGRRGIDRAGCRHHRHRRPAKARGGVVADPAASGQRVVRPHALQPAQRQALGCDRADHAPIARGRPRRPCADAGAVGGRAPPGDRR